MSEYVVLDKRTPHFAANDYRQMKGGKGTMPERMRDWEPLIRESQARYARWAAEGCCGHPDGPEWIECTDYRVLPDGTSEPTGTGTGHWSCRFAGKGGCCMNRVDSFVREFSAWLERGAPLHSEGEYGE